MNLQKKVIIGIDTLIILLVLCATIFNTNLSTMLLKSGKQLANNENLSFNLIASPEETRVKAGETVTIKLNVADINIGENGLNSIVGNLEYDESLFDTMNIEATENWNIELNQREGHSMYGKFCIYTIQEGVTEDQDVVTMTLKLKSDLKPQTTEVKFLNLKSSDGNLSVNEQDRIVKIIIYEDEIPEEPITPTSPQTGDSIILVVSIVIGLTILANIIVFGKNKKTKIICSLFVLIVGVTTTVLAQNTNLTVTEKIAKEENWLNSTKYLVTDTDITRIAPNTTVESFKSKFNKTVTISSQAEEVTTGVISTGMTAKVADETNEYTIGVAGDLDKDGDSNQVELTTIIRNVVDSTKWALDGINAKSADMKLDGIIDQKDVTASVNYIVYGELDIPDFEPVDAPTIEVVTGTFNQNINAYEDDIEIKITATEENAGDTKYKIVGTTDIEYAQIESGDTFTITENGIYKILAYTYGELGNRSEISSLVVSKKIATASYIVEHYKQELDGTYTKDEQATELKTGRIGETATAIAKTYVGFSENTTYQGRIASGIVTDDGSLVLKLYYDRNNYNYSVEYYYENVIDSNKTETSSAKFGSTINAYTDKVIEGYKLDTVVGMPLIISEVSTTNIIKVYYKKDVVTLTIHHYIEGTTTKVAEDEQIDLTELQTFTVTNLISDTNKIIIAGEEQTETREYLNAAKYTYVSVVRDEENTTLGTTTPEIANGAVSGTFAAEMQDITYYYHVNTFTITGEVVGGHGELQDKDKATFTEEIVKYGENSKKEIKVNPDTGYKIDKIMLYTGAEVDGSYGDTTDGGMEIADYDVDDNQIATLSVFTNVIENKHLVVTFKPREIVAQIVAVPVGSETMVSADGATILNHTYYSLKDAINDAAKANENPGIVEIKLLANIENETNVLEDENNVKLDLNGYIISSGANNPVITVKDAELVVQDKSVLETGKIISTKGIGILVTAVGECTLGANDSTVSPITPTVEGKIYGIYKEVDEDSGDEGILNYYDGIVIGGTTSFGGSTKIDDKPLLYDPSITTAGEQQEAILAIVSNVEALIGNKRYTLLEDAFADVETNISYNLSTPVEIDVVAEVTLEDAIQLSMYKNVVLDLNGHAISATKANYMFENAGKMQIKDSTAEIDENETYADIVTPGAYGFVKIGDHLESNNQGVASSTANSYIKIDLTQEATTQEFTLAVNANVSSEASRDFGFATVTTTTDVPLVSSTEGRFMYISSYGYPTDYTTTLTGGNTYYLHLGYSKNDSTDSYLDTLIINGITLNGKSLIDEAIQGKGKISSTTYDTILNKEAGELVFKSGNIVSSRYGITNTGTFNMEGGSLINSASSVVWQKTAEESRSVFKGGTIINTNGAAVNCNKGNITLQDTIRIYASGSGVFASNTAGTVKIANATIQSNSNQSACLLIGPENLILENATLTGINGITLGYTTAPSVTIKNAKIRVSGEALKNEGANLTIEDIDIISTGSGIVNSYIASCTSDTYIKNAKIVSSKAAISNTTKNTTTIDNANITKIGTTYSAIDNSTQGIIVINNVIVNSQAIAINNHGTGQIDINDGTFVSRSDTVAQNETGILNVYGGKLENTYTNGAGIINGKGTVNIGIKNTEADKTVSTTTPNIKGILYGIQNLEGTVNMYDGIVSGKQGTAILGSLAEVEKKDAAGNNIDLLSNTVTENEIEMQQLTVGIPSAPVAKIAKSSTEISVSGLVIGDYTQDTDNYYFNTLGSAISACSNSAGSNVTTIQVINDIYTGKNNIISEGQNIKIDLNGKQIVTYNKIAGILNNGTLKIEDSSENGIIKSYGLGIKNNSNMELISGKIMCGIISTNIYETVVNNTGTLNINGGTISSQTHAYSVYNTGTVNLNNGTIEAIGSSTSGIYNAESGICNITGGTISVTATGSNSAQGIYNADTATINITGGTINSTYWGIRTTSTSKYEEGVSNPAINITGGTIECQYDGIRNDGSGDIIIKKATGSTINISSRSYEGIETESYDGIIDVDGANISSIRSSNKTIVKNSTISGEILVGYKANSTVDSEITNSTVSGTVTNRTTGTMTINNSKISVTGSNSAVQNSGTGTIIIPAVGETVITGGPSNTGNGIYMSSAGTVIVGTKGDGVVSTQYPKITGNTGVKNANTNGIFKFYDGIIIGTTSNSISGSVTEQEDGYDIIKTNDSEASTESAILKKVTIANIAEEKVAVANLTGLEYTHESGYYGFYTLHDAAVACTDNADTTVTLTRDVIFTRSRASETIPSGKNINLDLNGKTMSIANKNSIVNNGTLKLLDSSATKTSFINATNENTFNNTGTITFEEIRYYNSISGTDVQKGIDEEKTSSIENSGTINVIGGKFWNTSYAIQVFKNMGTLNISNSATISANGGRYSRTIYNIGEVNINSAIMDNIIYNAGTGTIEITDINSTGCIINNSTSVYSEGVTKPAVRMTGGIIRYDEDCSGASIVNNAGEVIIDKAQDSTLEISSNTYYCDYSLQNYKDAKMTVRGAKISTETINNGELKIDSAIIGSTIANAYNETETVKLTITGTTQITGNITNGATGTIDFESGSINYASGTAISNNGVLNLGKNDGTINTTNPSITASAEDNRYGIYNYATLNYYDGTIIGKTAVVGTISNIPENAEVVYNKDMTETLTIGNTTAVASIGTTNYNTLKEAIAACTTSENRVIKILKPIAIPIGREITISSTQNITLDLNGNDIMSYYAENGIVNEGTLTITDTSVDSAGRITGYANTLIKNTGVFKLVNGRLQNFGLTTRVVILNESAGTIEMTGGIIDAYLQRYADGTAISSTGVGNITISGGEINCYGSNNYSKSTAIYINNVNEETIPLLTFTGDAKITSNSTKGDTYGVNIIKGANLLISGGRIETYYSIDSGNSNDITENMTVEINAGEILGRTSLYHLNAVIKGTADLGDVGMVNGSTLLLQGGTIGSLSNSAAIVKMSGGKITEKQSQTYGVVYNQGSFEMTGGEIQATSSIALRNENNAIAIITNGTISSESAYGIYNIGTGKLVLGVEDYPVEKTMPSISGGTYGLYQGSNLGTVSFYDGIIHGSTKAIYGVIAKIPELHSVVFSDNTETTAYLGIVATVEQVAKVGTLYYNTLAGAVEAVKSSGGIGTIEIAKDIVLSESLQIEEGLHVTIDLQAHSIKYASEENATIENNGNLTLIDTAEDGSTTLLGAIIQNVAGVAINNNGTLNIGVNDSNVWTNSPRIIGETYGIVNGTEATLNFYDGIIKGITGVINGTITSITNQTGYTEQDGTYVEGEGEEAITYLTKYLGI